MLSHQPRPQNKYMWNRTEEPRPTGLAAWPWIEPLSSSQRSQFQLMHRFMRISDGCFKPLNFKVACYTALVWRYLTNTNTVLQCRWSSYKRKRHLVCLCAHVYACQEFCISFLSNDTQNKKNMFRSGEISWKTSWFFKSRFSWDSTVSDMKYLHDHE